MVDNTSESGRQAVELAMEAARQSSTLGPGTAGYTTSGAAYRGKEVAGNTGAAPPAEVGFGTDNGLGYAEEGSTKSGFAKSQKKEPV
ncbi:MAG: hypothetical protein K0R39_1778 [Symbiobacteriaceae bacterium]|jgi:hypothetical protein|nr:hypothetical protein [Symbiobacteriaceae bacterium]